MSCLFCLFRHRNRNLPKISLQNRSRLMSVAYKDVDFYSLKGYRCWAKVVKVYDGDTVTVAFYNRENILCKYRVRLLGIDTPELRSTNPAEVAAAKKSRERLVELINDQLVILECDDWDKYGRLLATVSNGKKSTKSFNQTLLDEKLAYQYDGGTKDDVEY